MTDDAPFELDLPGLLRGIADGTISCDHVTASIAAAFVPALADTDPATLQRVATRFADEADRRGVTIAELLTDLNARSGPNPDR